MQLGTPCIRTWSKTQNTIAQSSAESELLAIVLGLSFSSRLHVDATAALGILERKGVGRIRHLDVGSLWLHEVQLRQKVELIKVKGTSNPADLMTENLPRESVTEYSNQLSFEFREGRSDTTAQLHYTTLQKAHVAPGKEERDVRGRAVQEPQTETGRATVRRSTLSSVSGPSDRLAARRRSARGEEDNVPSDKHAACQGPLSNGPDAKREGIGQKKDEFECDPERGVSGSRQAPRSRRRHRSRRDGEWEVIAPGHLRGRSRGARAFRAPYNIRWSDVIQRCTRDEVTGENIEHVIEGQNSIPAKVATRNLDRVRDYTVPATWTA